MSEHSEQCALFEWAAWQVNLGCDPLRLMFAIPNGGQRHKAVAAKLKAEGVKAGVPDIFLAWPSGNYHGLFIEMKVGKNKPSQLQEEWIAGLFAAGYACVVCYGFEAAKLAICDYMKDGGYEIV